MTIDELGESIAFGILSGVLGGSGAGSNALKSQASRMGEDFCWAYREYFASYFSSRFIHSKISRKQI